MNWIARASLLPLLVLQACYGPAEPRREDPNGRTGADSGPTGNQQRAEPASIEVLATRDPTPAGGDGSPLLTLAFRFAAGKRLAIDGEARAYVPFRDGVALIDVSGQLALVTPRGTRSVLARAAAAIPARGPEGELVYAARYEGLVEVHRLTADGRDRVVASGLGSAGVLAPQPDGRTVFVGTRRGGGVAGLWLAEAAAPARCLTNCRLETSGTALDSRFVPLPSDAGSIAIAADTLSWRAADGTLRAMSLGTGSSALPETPTSTDSLGGTR